MVVVNQAEHLYEDQSVKPEEVIYLDYQSTTPVDQRVIDVMLPFLGNQFGNPHSRSHVYGWQASGAVENAREHIAKLINADSREVIFTSGATESNNLAIKGVAEFYHDKGKHIITCVTEHKCVLESCRALEQKGFEITYLPVQKDGRINLDDLKKAIRSDTILVSIMFANNEIGVLQPIAEIGKICRENGVFFHTDAAQATGKVTIDVKEMNIDMLSISGHKMYGPKGIGALYVCRRPRVRIKALISGGGQERGMRSGTLAPFLCVGLGKACEIAYNEMERDYEYTKSLRDYFFDKVMSNLEEVHINGSMEHRLPNNLNLGFAYVEGEGLMMGMKQIALSSGSACTSASLEPSYVLRALGVTEDLAHTSIRFGFGRCSTREEVDGAVNLLISSVKRLRAMSPLYEMAKKGIDISKVQWTQH